MCDNEQDHENGSTASVGAMDIAGNDSTTASPAAANSYNANHKTICHVLPCNIEYNGMAPSHVYFRPTEVEKGISAATFRGRGLLAKTANNNYNTKAMLLELDQGTLKVKSDIDEVMEWQHEHNLDALKYDDTLSRFQVAHAWGEVASAVSVVFVVALDRLVESKSRPKK
jgi:Ribonuclease H2 non-catalytic subunit (Ylr154p-like)